MLFFHKMSQKPPSSDKKEKSAENGENLEETQPPAENLKTSQNSLRLEKTTESGPVCKFDEFGCQIKGTKDGIKKHVEKEPVRHLSLVGDAVIDMRRNIFALNAEIGNEMEIFEGLYVRHDRLRKRHGSHLVWKISGYNEKLEDAQDGTQTVIFSPPFLTAVHGYKMIASTALNGDGKGQGKFVSIFISLMRGNFDSLLPWPFRHAITFTVLDQSENVGQRKDISYTIVPNSISENKAYLDRPIQERNPSFGYQRFAEISALQTMEYVKDNNLFIRIHVDEADMDVL